MNGALRVSTITLSDTRTPADDTGGALLRERLTAAGFMVLEHEIVPEEREQIRAALQVHLGRYDIDAVVMTGGTGIAPRDRTVEAVRPLFDKELEGFGEAFRRLSWDEVGARAILSRAIAGVAAGKVVVCLPGSLKAVTLAVDKVLAPVLAHAVELASGRSTQHAPSFERGAPEPHAGEPKA